MTTTTVLLLLVAAASTIAFSPAREGWGEFSAVSRRRRDAPAEPKASSGAMSFSSSSSSSSSSGPGYSTSISSRSGYPDASSYAGNSVNPGGFVHTGVNDFNFQNPNYGNPYQNQYPGYVPVDFNALFRQYLEFMSRVAQQNAYAQNDISTRGGFGADSNFGAPAPNFYFPSPSNYGPAGANFGPGGGFGGNPGDVSASASANLSPRGGFGYASINPPPQGNPELATRMGNIPPSGGGDGNYAVFTSSSSGSSDVNGVKKSHKEATSVINDNGKVTTFHVSDP